MRTIRNMAILLVLGAMAPATAQITERPRPEAWSKLVLGGRFMDRFRPIPPMGPLTDQTWGADNVVPRYVENGLEEKEWSYWGGNALRGADGKYHLFVCRWREDSERGHGEWPRSQVVHAVADSPLGPYKAGAIIGPGHNPEIYQLKDGRYVLYVIDARYMASDLNGPWEKSKFTFDPRDRRIIEGLSNLSFARRADGSFIMVCRGGGIWFSQTGVSPWLQVTDRRVYPPVEGRFEDPVIWRTNVQYHLIVNDWYGRIAYYLRSKDGVNWKVEPGEAYLPGIARYADGTVEDWFKYERIKVLQDETGRATQAHFAVIDVLKGNDKGSDNHSSKHICIPLTVGRLVTVLNQEPLSAETKSIRLKIAAEEGFDPSKDMDVASLRFGASDVVNFGGGSRVTGTEPSGKDLIVTFDGTGNGFTDENFAGKLLGKTREGKLLFGWARLPGVEYLEPILSARLPRPAGSDDSPRLNVEVQNFGQVASKEASLKILLKEGDKEEVLATGAVSGLQPFEVTTIELPIAKPLAPEAKHRVKVVIDAKTQYPSILEGEMKAVVGE